MPPNLASSVFKQGTGALFCAAVSFALLLLLARALGSEAFGSYAALLNAATLGLIAIEGGWPSLVYRERAAVLPHEGTAGRGDATVSRAMAHVLLVSAGLMGLTAFAAGSNSARSDWQAACVCMAAVAVMNLVSANMRGAGRFGLEALWQSAGRVTSAAGVLLVVTWWGLNSPAWIFLAWAVGLAVVIAFGARQWLVQPRFEGLAKSYRQVLPFVMIAATAAWLVKGDLVVLGAMQGTNFSAEALSMYAVCTRLTEAGLLGFAPLGNVLLRSFSLLKAEQPAPTSFLGGLLGRCLALALVSGTSAVLLAWGFGEAVVVWLFGAPYAAAGALLPWVVAMLPFALANLVLSPWLTVQGLERGLAACMLLAGVFMAVTLVWWTGRWGIQGAATAVAASHALLLGLSLLLAFRAKR